MVRKLPWDRNKARPRDTVRRHSSSPRPALTARGDDSPQTRGRQSSASRDPRASAVAQRFRTPSTSPPPAPPAESFMIEGMDHDDRYRMVEDELLSAAHEFTAHLHAAEYQRLKTMAKSLGSEAIHNISRPVTDGPTYSVRRQLEAARRAEKLQRGLRRAFGSGDDDDAGRHEDAPWKGTALQDIMEGGARKAALMPLLVPAARRPIRADETEEETEDDAEAGVNVDKDKEEEEDDDDEDEDDLDGPSTWRQPAPRQGETAVAQKPAVSPATNVTTTTRESRPEKDRDVDDADSNNVSDVSDSLDTGSLLQKMRERRQREKAQRQQQRRRQRQEKGTDLASTAT